MKIGPKDINLNRKLGFDSYASEHTGQLKFALNSEVAAAKSGAVFGGEHKGCAEGLTCHPVFYMVAYTSSICSRYY